MTTVIKNILKRNKKYDSEYEKKRRRRKKNHRSPKLDKENSILLAKVRFLDCIGYYLPT